MDILYFLKRRTEFIRSFYQKAGDPYRETKRKIEAGEAPFDHPPYYGGEEPPDEPPFLQEWLDADEALEVLGRTCLSMLSASLQLSFKTWERDLWVVEWKLGEKKDVFGKGFVQGYRTLFGQFLKIDWKDCPVNFDILEQVTLARNRDQHPEHLTQLEVTHAPEDRRRFQKLFFVDEGEESMFSDTDNPWLMPTIRVSQEKLLAAIGEVEGLGEWLEDRISDHLGQRRLRRE